MPEREHSGGSAAPRLSEIAAAIIESSEDAIYSKSLDGVIQSWNAAAARLYGYAADEVLRRPVTLLLPPERVGEEREILARLAQGERIERYETERLRKDGSRFVAQLTISPIHDEHGRIVAASTSTQDITQRKRTERQLRSLAAIVESSEDAIYSKSLDGVIQSWNAAAARLYGYTEDEVLGRPVTLLLPRERVEEEREILARLAQGDRIERYETERLRKDGSRFEAQLTISPIHDEHGRIVAASTSSQDITQRKRAEREQKLLVDASSVVAASRSVDELLREFAALLVPALADWCSVDLVDETGALRSVLLVDRDPGRAEQARRLPQRVAGDARAEERHRRVLATRRSELLPEISDETLNASLSDLEALEEVRGLGLKSALLVPLVARGRSLGVLALASAESGHRYTAEDQMFVEQLAERAALGLDNVQLHEAETEARRAAELNAARIGRLQAFTAALSEAVTPEQVGEVALDYLLQALSAAAAAVLVRSQDSDRLVPVATRGFSPHADEPQRGAPAAVEPLEEAMRSGRVVWYPSWAALRERFPRGSTPAESAFKGAIAAAPVILHGRALGGFYLNFVQERSFGAEELEFMLTFGRQCAQALERARLYAREHQVASTLQRALLPASLPEAPGMRLDAAYDAAARAADVGGDWYDVFRLPDGRMCAAIGDVVGHGLEAAVVMGQMRQSVRTAALEGHDPATVLQLADHVVRLNQRAGMTTAIVGLLDVLTGTFTYAAAGHPGPILASPAGVESLPSGGLPIGFLGDAPPPSWTIQLPPGALLVFYTDGLIEFARDPAAGHAALLAAIRGQVSQETPNPARRILEQVLDGASPVDDIAIVVLATAKAPLDRLEMSLPAEPGSLRIARQAIQQLSAGIGLGEAQAFALNVAVGEAVNNVIEHAYGASPGSLQLRARRENSTVRVEIEDTGRWRPDRPQENLGGRGFKLMRALIDSVDVATGEHGTKVRFTLGLHADPVPAGAPGAHAAGGHAETAGPVSPNDVRDRQGPRPAGGAGWGGLRAETRLQGSAPTIIPAGEIDLSNIGEFVRIIEETAAKAQGLVVVVLDRVTYFDSQGIRALLSLQQRLATGRRRLAIVAPPSAPIRRLLDISGLQSAFPIFDSVDAAITGSAS